jgi:hypothetical protein
MAENSGSEKMNDRPVPRIVAEGNPGFARSLELVYKRGLGSQVMDKFQLPF